MVSVSDYKGELTDEQIAEFAVHLAMQDAKVDSFVPLDHQKPPPHDNWETWLLLAGRGAGKTRVETEYAISRLRKMKSKSRIGFMSPTNKDAREVCAEGESGLITMYGKEFTKYNRTTGEAWHRDGGFVKFKGAEEAESWRGPQWSDLLIDEFCVCNQEAVELALFGLRLGENPKLVVATTPKPIQELIDLIEDPTTHVSYATTFDNPYLSARAVERLRKRHEGTNLGRQELLAEIIRDVEGAFWDHETLDLHRVPVGEVTTEDMDRLVIAIDPSGTAARKSDYTGICVAGLMGTQVYIFSITPYKVHPDDWAKIALMLYIELRADAIVAERNNGADMVEGTIRNMYRAMKNRDEWEGIPPNIKTVFASRGKKTRAEPVSVLDMQGDIHHVGLLEEAEDQMCQYPVSHRNDDLVDARVWAVTELLESIRVKVTTPPTVFKQKDVWSK